MRRRISVLSSSLDARQKSEAERSRGGRKQMGGSVGESVRIVNTGFSSARPILR